MNVSTLQKLFQTIAYFFLFTGCVFVVPVYADVEGSSWNIDSATLKKGYLFSFQNNDMKLSFPPGAYEEEGQLTVQRFEAGGEAPIPLTLEKKSDIFLFDISAKKYKKPITILLKQEKYEKGIALYFYDRNQKKWRKLPTTIRADGYISAPTRLSFATVAVFKEKEPTLEEILTSLHAIIVANGDGNISYAKNTDQPFPIASLSKLMTALVFLDHNPGWNTSIRIRPSDDTEPAKIAFRNGDTIRVKDLFYSMLVGSKNNAAKALARSTGLSEILFVEAMNAKARELGMTHTFFRDSTGLDSKNVSSVFDQYMLAKIALHQADIRKATMTKKYTFTVLNTGRRLTVQTTNTLLYSSSMITGGKTGYLDEAGYNLTVSAKNKQQELFVVLLGAPDSITRFNVAKKILDAELGMGISKR